MKMLERQRIREEKIKAKEEAIKIKELQLQKQREEKRRSVKSGLQAGQQRLPSPAHSPTHK